MQHCIQKKDRNHEGETACGNKSNSTAAIVRTRGEKISPQNFTSLLTALIFEDFLFALVVSTYLAAQVSVTVLHI